MSLLRKLFGGTENQTKVRVRICIECGMPVPDHKDWCAIRRMQATMDERRAGSAGDP